MKGVRIGGKMHTLSYEQLQDIYPEFHSFLQARKSLDELGMFFNPYAEKLFIPLFGRAVRPPLIKVSHYVYKKS